MNKADVGKLFTTDGKDTWKMLWYAEVGEIGEGGNTYHIKNQATSEALTQLVFYPKEEEDED